MPGRKLVEGKDYKLSFELILDMQKVGYGRKRMPLEVTQSAAFKKLIRDYVDDVCLEQELKVRTPEEWQEAILALDCPEVIRSWAGAIAWWDYTPSLPVTTRWKLIQKLSEQMINIWSATIYRKPTILKLKELGVGDEKMIPELFLDGQLGVKDLPETMWKAAEGLQQMHESWKEARDEQLRWSEMGNRFVHTGADNIMLASIDLLLAALKGIGYTHPEDRVGNTGNYNGIETWKTKFRHKVLTKWGKEVTAHGVFRLRYGKPVRA
jgi:hypothetical protein